MTTLKDAFEWELTLECGGYESGSESLSITTRLCQAPQLYHVSALENVSFGPATPRACPSQQPGTLTMMCYHLTFEEDDEYLLNKHTLLTRMEHHSPDKLRMAHHFSSIEEDEEEEDTDEHFPTASLDDDVWMEEPVQDSQHELCLYCCPYSLDQLHLALDYTPQYINLSEIFNLPDVITTASNKDIPNLEDVLQI